MDRPNRQQRENEEITNTGGGVEDYDLLPCIAHNIPTYQCRECSNVGTPTPSSQTPNYPSPQRTHAKPYYTSQSPPSTYAQALIQSPTPAPRPVGGTNRDGKRPEQPRAKSPRPPQQCPKGPVAIPVKGQPVSGSNTYAQVAAPRNNFIGYRDPRYPQPMPTPQRAQPQQGQIHPESSAQAQARYPMLSMRQEVPEQTRPPQAAYITPQQTPIQPGRGANNANGYDINPIPGDVAGWINQASQTPSRFYKINTTNVCVEDDVEHEDEDEKEDEG
ncbi:Hypothetical protein R9X50_00198500 [Acrodontium crateriforme]|uniref:Uncharacterized protein n=1 Tax=Acrodontium crateriforme TaxID=150365 RepID=A0AAQ3R8M0_9PEZI|nr:Hypothetical protein R9X50_00198500 [Acrodontium crateriforme]